MQLNTENSPITTEELEQLISVKPQFSRALVETLQSSLNQLVLTHQYSQIAKTTLSSYFPEAVGGIRELVNLDIAQLVIMRAFGICKTEGVEPRNIRALSLVISHIVEGEGLEEGISAAPTNSSVTPDAFKTVNEVLEELPSISTIDVDPIAAEDPTLNFNIPPRPTDSEVQEHKETQSKDLIGADTPQSSDSPGDRIDSESELITGPDTTVKTSSIIEDIVEESSSSDYSEHAEQDQSRDKIEPDEEINQLKLGDDSVPEELRNFLTKLADQSEGELQMEDSPMEMADASDNASDNAGDSEMPEVDLLDDSIQVSANGSGHFGDTESFNSQSDDNQSLLNIDSGDSDSMAPFDFLSEPPAMNEAQISDDHEESSLESPAGAGMQRSAVHEERLAVAFSDLKASVKLQALWGRKLQDFWSNNWPSAPFEQSLTFGQLLDLRPETIVKKKSFTEAKLEAILMAIDSAVHGRLESNDTSKELSKSLVESHGPPLDVSVFMSSNEPSIDEITLADPYKNSSIRPVEGLLGVRLPSYASAVALFAERQAQAARQSQTLFAKLIVSVSEQLARDKLFFLWLLVEHSRSVVMQLYGLAEDKIIAMESEAEQLLLRICGDYGSTLHQQWTLALSTPAVPIRFLTEPHIDKTLDEGFQKALAKMILTAMGAKEVVVGADVWCRNDKMVLLILDAIEQILPLSHERVMEEMACYLSLLDENEMVGILSTRAVRDHDSSIWKVR